MTACKKTIKKATPLQKIQADQCRVVHLLANVKVAILDTTSVQVQ